MRSRGIKVVLFTSNNDLPVKAYGDVCFNCSIKSVSCKNSLTAPMCLTNYLVAELALRNYEEAHDVLANRGNTQHRILSRNLIFTKNGFPREAVFSIYPALCP